MTSLRIALTELRRITAGRMPRIAVIALVLIPTLYGGLYLYANHDPYGNLKYVPAALVVADQGALDAKGNPVHAGTEVADQLTSSHSFDWHQVSAARARSGVADGTYDFALTIPPGFSTALTSSAQFDARQARLQMTTNDANSYLSTTIANTVTDKVRDALATRVSREAAASFLLGITQIRSSLVQAVGGATKVTDATADAQKGAQQLTTGSKSLQSGAGKLKDSAGKLDDGLGTLADKTTKLPARTRTLATGSRKVSDGTKQVAGAGRSDARAAAGSVATYSRLRGTLRQVMFSQGLNYQQRQAILGVYDQAGPSIRATNRGVQSTSSTLGGLAAGAGRVASSNKSLADDTATLIKGIGTAHDSTGALADDAATLGKDSAKLRGGATELDTGLGKVHDGAAQLQRGLKRGVRTIPAADEETRNRVATTIGDPVAVRSASQASAGSYGAGLAPFFLSLAAWIGAYVMFLLIRPLSKRAMSANQTPLRVAAGGWLTPALVGVVQMVVLFSLVAFGIDIVPSHLLGTLGFMVLVSATFVAVVHALNAWLGRPGQFLGLVLMVLQLATAGGTFPWQTIPQPLHWLHQVLPMSYAVDGLRQLMYGGLDSIVLRDVLVLAGFLVGAVLLSAVAAQWQRVWTVRRIKPELVL